MPYENAERLSALDAMFLGIEAPEVHMHTGSLLVFEAGALRAEDGGLEIDRIEQALQSSISYIPRLHQRIDHVPLIGHPVWIDDDRFNLRFHVRHLSLPRPGNLRQLKRMAGRILSQPLDRGKPLWEMCFIDGLEGGRFAQICKVHHCMVDGASGVDLMTALLATSPDATPKPARRWVTSTKPGSLRLLVDELKHRAGFPLAAVRAGRALMRDPQRTLATLQQTLAGVGEFLLNGVVPASDTPLNLQIGPYRRFDWMDVDLDRIKLIKRRLGGTINDVILTCVAGAMRTFLSSRGVRVTELDFRAATPVNSRKSGTRAAGNHVSSLIIELPVGEADPRERLRRVIEATGHAKSTHQEVSTQVFEELSDRTFPSLLVQMGQAVSWLRPCNTIVTNVPGPSFPLYMLGARLLEVYPYVPLLGNTGVAIALFSYDGHMFWGFNGEWDEFPDLHDLVEAVATEIETLFTVADCHTPPAAASKRKPTSATARRKRKDPLRKGTKGSNDRSAQTAG